MKVWNWLGLLLLAFASANAAALDPQESDKVILYLQLHDQEDEAFPHAERAFQEYRQAMQAGFPLRPVRRIVAHNKQHLDKQLRGLLQDNEKISHLYIRAHGSSWESDEGVGMRLVLGPETRSERLEISSSSRDGEVFAGIHGRFTSDSQVIAESCYLFQGDDATAKRKAAAFQQALGQTSGSMYGNCTAGCASTSGEGYEKAAALKNWQAGALGGGFMLAALLGIGPLSSLPLLASAAAGAFMFSNYRVFARQAAALTDPYNQGYRIHTKDSKIVMNEPGRMVDFKYASMKPACVPQPQPPVVSRNKIMGTSFSLSHKSTDACSVPKNTINLTDVMDPFNY